jgi:beta-lactamase superfamily II metal-dependent hydrolase
MTWGTALSRTQPDADQLEITLIGPGQGECCVAHLGSGQWIIVDSCRNSQTRHPVALEYFAHIGTQADLVILIVATHWHDDHISGLAATLQACGKAKLCCSSALSSREFLAAVAPYNERLQFAGSSRVSELFEVLHELDVSRRTSPTRAGPDRRIVRLQPSSLAHGYPCEIWTLSPSDAQMEAFYSEIGQLVPQLRETKARLPSQKTNLLSVVTLVQVGPFAALLGADLEETANPQTGWTPIVRSTARPGAMSQIFKVPHHGSENGHSPEVWTAMLKPKPISIATPYSGGRNAIPSEQDKARISQLSSDFYVTAPTQPGRPRKLPNAVEKTIAEHGIKLRPVEPCTGLIRLRNGGGLNPNAWSVELAGNAYLVR